MAKSLFISPCSQLLTLAGSSLPRKGFGQSELSIIEDGAVLIEGEIIKAVGTSEELEGSLSGKEVQRVSGQECVVMPGFVDSHAHPIFAKPRDNDYEMRIKGATYQQIAEQGGGILSSVRSVRNTPKDQLLKSSRTRIGRFLEYGTTTLEAKSGYGLNVENEFKILEVISQLQQTVPLELVPTFLGAHEVPEEYRSRRDEYLGLVIAHMIPMVAGRKLAEYCDCFVEPPIFSLEEAEQVLLSAQKHGLKIKLHADQLSRSGATQLGIRLRAVSIDHLEQILPEDIEALSEAGIIATLLPGAVFHLGLKRYPPARALIDAGVPVALATDFNPGTSPTLNMQIILSIACTQMRMTPAEAIVASTINGAHALCRGDRLGSLEVGKQADLCIMDVEDYRQIPYFFGINHCKMTLKKGQIVYLRKT